MSKIKYKSAKSLHNNNISTNNENEILIKGKKDIYSISDTLGKGTFGKVKLAYSTIRNPHKKYACKILEKLNMKEKDDKKRCQREMSILLQMNHRNVIKTTEIISDSSRYYIIMEFCQKGELFNHIVEQQNFNEEKSAFYYYQLISGVDYIHSKNICHRDLKPENLLINDKNELKIIDFGLSNFFLGEDKLLKTPCGSPCYASPEMILGKDYNGFCIDVWSSGIILFAMLCGYLPFEEGEGDINNELLFRNIVQCKVDYPEEYIGPIAKDLLEKIIVREPKERITIKQIKKHPFFLLGKEVYSKIVGFENNISYNNYYYGTFRRFNTMNFNDIDSNLDYKYNNIINNKENKNNNYINVNKKKKIYNSLHIDYLKDSNNYNDIYMKTNYDRNIYRNNYLNLLENDIIAYKFLNSSINNDNNNDISIKHNFNSKEKNAKENNNNNSHSVNNNKKISNNKYINNYFTGRNNDYIYNHKNSRTLDIKFNANDIKNILDDKTKIQKNSKTIKDSQPKLGYQQYNLFTLNNRESNFFNNYLEKNYNNISNYNNENDINMKYMKTDINFTNNKFRNTNSKTYRNYINQKKYDESSKYINTNTNKNMSNNLNKKKTVFRNTFRKEKINTPQISLYKGLIFNNQKQPLVRNQITNNNSIRRVYNNFINKNQSPQNNNNKTNKNKYSIEFRNNSKNINNSNKNKISKNSNNKTYSYTNYIQNICDKKNYTYNTKNLSPKYLNENQNIKNILTESGNNPLNINNNSTPYSFNTSIKQFLKYYNNSKKINNNNSNQNTINNRIINSQNNKNQKTKINYNLTSTNIDNYKNKSNKNSHANLSINKKENNFYTSRPKSQKPQNIIKNKKNFNNNHTKRKATNNNILYTDVYANSIDYRKNVYNEKPKNNQNEENNNKIIINFNILKPKIILDEKNSIKRNKNKYSSSLIKTYNNIDINCNKNNLKKNGNKKNKLSFTHNIFEDIINKENNINSKEKNNNALKKSQKK